MAATVLQNSKSFLKCMEACRCVPFIAHSKLVSFSVDLSVQHFSVDSIVNLELNSHSTPELNQNNTHHYHIYQPCSLAGRFFKIVCFNINVFECTLIDSLISCYSNINKIHVSKLFQSVTLIYFTHY
jgi:hypothetical protein